MRVTSKRAAPVFLGVVVAVSLALAAWSDDESKAPVTTVPVPTIQVVGSTVLPEVTARQRALLDSLSPYPGATMVREYISQAGGLAREYATDLALDQAPTSVTNYYRDALQAQGFQTLQEHAAVSAYVKGNDVVQILRDGTEPSQPTPEEKTLAKAPVPPSAKFFFAVEVDLKN